MTVYTVIIKARIHLYSTSKGGREGYIASGYRPNFLFGDNINCDGSILFEKKEIQPGEKAYVTVRLFSPEPIVVPDVHAAFVFREGTKIVGNGAVVVNYARKKQVIPKQELVV